MLAVVSWPILERIPLFGDLAISPHGIGIAAGVLLGSWMVLRRARQRGLGAPVDDVDEAVQSLLGWVLLGAIAGARGFYGLNNFDVYASDPLSALAVWEGGLTLLGGITGGAIAGLIVVRRRRWRPGLLLDAAAPGLAAGIAVGRLGDLTIGDHLGAPAPGNLLAWQCNGNLWERATNSFGWVPPQPATRPRRSPTPASRSSGANACACPRPRCRARPHRTSSASPDRHETHPRAV